MKASSRGSFTLDNHFRFLGTKDYSQHKGDIKEQTGIFFIAAEVETTKQGLVSYCSDVFSWNVKQNAVPLHLTKILITRSISRYGSSAPPVRVLPQPQRRP